MKKVLSFVLVLAMVLGSVAMVFAADFTDQASITNTEASKVLAGIGVIEGYTDGSFKPAGILTRAEGAAILARMVLGKEEAAKLTTVVSPFKDVPASHWAAGYISYCVAQGYIDGYGDGNFGPEDTLKVAEFGKMMLTAVGYKSQNEGFTGANWDTNVGSVMVKAGLTDGVTMTGSNACSREVAAQVALNTLKATEVEYDGTPVTVSTGSVTVTTGQSNAKQIRNTTATDVNYDPDGIFGDGYMQFMEDHQKDLKLQSIGGDDFQRPDTAQWTFKNENLYKTTSTKHLIAKYTTKITEGAFYTLLKDHDALGKAVNLATDGAGPAAQGAVAVDGAFKNSTKALYTAGNGSQVEVYYDATGAGQVTVVIYNYYLAQAVGDYKASSNELKVSVNGATKTLSGKDFAITDAKDEDYFVVTLAGGDVKSFAPATKVTGTISAYTEGSNVTINGTKYTKSGVAGTDAPLASLSTATDITLINDPNGFVLKTTDATAYNQYVYIRKVATTSGLETNYIADAVFIDGTRSEIKIKKVGTNTTGLETVGGANATAPKWYAYAVNDKGEYTLKDDGNVTATLNVTLNDKNVNYTNNAALKKASNDTVFVVLDKNKNVNVYTGYKNAPNSGAGTVDVAAVVDKDATAFAKYVFVDGLATGTVMYGAKTSDYVVLYKNTAAASEVNDGTKYYTFDQAILNGVAGPVQFSEDITGDINTASVAAGIYYQVAYDSNNRITQATKLLVGVTGEFTVLTGGKAVTATPGAISYKSGVLTIISDDTTPNTFKTASDVKVFVVDSRKDYAKVTEDVKVDKILQNLTQGVTYDVYTVWDNTTDQNCVAIYFVR